MQIVDTTLPVTAERTEQMILKIVRKYPFCRTELLTTSAFGRPIRTLVIGRGPRRVLYTAAHHANEWITTLILLKFVEEWADAIAVNGQIFGMPARELEEAATVCMVPLVDPDGVDLVTGAAAPGTPQYAVARSFAENYPQIPFPSGWKANLLGVDLNLQYPAGWLKAREIKFMQGFISPAPRDYVGRAPLNQRETKALAGYTETVDPALVLAYHTQGREIYWQFGDIEIPGARELGEKFAELSGYALAQPEESASYAGYKDWFIKKFRRPGYTVEAGLGENPLPLSRFPEIYRENLGILVTAAGGI